MPQHHPATNTVLVVEDVPDTRQRLAAVIGGHPQLLLQDAVSCCTEARRQIAHAPPRVLLTDLGLPDGSGIDIIAEIRRSHPDTECMVISIFGDEKSVVDAFEAGASGYLLKDGGADYIGKAILQLLAGGAPISAAVARHLLKRFRPAPDNNDPDLLTPREYEILDYITLGFHYQEIANRLHISFHTVNTHLKNIYRKLEVTSRQQAIVTARRRGLLKVDG